MAAGGGKRRPAKIASKKKEGTVTRNCPITGKPMIPIKVVRQDGPTGMYWVVAEDFDGSEQALSRMIPIR
jgi:hypothetical protein